MELSSYRVAGHYDNESRRHRYRSEKEFKGWRRGRSGWKLPHLEKSFRASVGVGDVICGERRSLDRDESMGMLFQKRFE
ncbi:hypothetical protein TNCV_3809241 [Trichonephila clavipes]|nr:hypothetical protein TNCV_3809241 [Trichonephila clavipes]